MRCFFLGFAGFFLAALLAAIAFSAYGDYAARASLSNSMQSIAPLQTRIAENILSKTSTQDAGTDLDPPVTISSYPDADFLKVASNGTIVFRSKKHGQIIVLEPAYNAGVVSWKCTGSSPAKNLPIKCR